jgi:hypothetical protein
MAQQQIETPATTGTTLVDVKGLKVYFPIKGGLLAVGQTHCRQRQAEWN